MSDEIPIENILMRGYALFPLLFNVIFRFVFESTIRKVEEISGRTSFMYSINYNGNSGKVPRKRHVKEKF
jgi:hypothetical protein